MNKSARATPVGGCGAQGDPRGFGGLGPASPEGSDFQGAATAPPHFNGADEQHYGIENTPL